MYCDDRLAYAKYKSLVDFSYNIISKLIESESAEIIWKLLSGSHKDDWKKPKLTLEEKRKLIYDGSIDTSGFRVFMDNTLDDGIALEVALLRIYPLSIMPKTRTNGICTIAFEVLAHSNINHLSNYTTRIDSIIQALIESLNGVDIAGLGVLFLNGEISRMDGMKTLGNVPFKGKVLMMSTNVG